MKKSTSLFHRIVSFFMVPILACTLQPAPLRGQVAETPIATMPGNGASILLAQTDAPVTQTDPAGATTVPTTGPDFSTFTLPDLPSVVELDRCRAFSESLAVSADTSVTDEERQSLGRMMENYVHAGGHSVYANIEKLDLFLQTFPQSPLAPGVYLEKAKLCRRHGNLIRSYQAAAAAWDAGQKREDREGRVQAEVALTHVLEHLVQFGRTAELQALLATLQNRKVGGAAREAIWRARSSLWFLKNRAELNIACGYTAANAICVPRGLSPIFPDVDDEAAKQKFINQGISLYELREENHASGGNFRIVKATSPTALPPVPSVMHWKLGHYSAISEKQGERYRIQDQQFKLDVLAPASVVVEQSSGYYLVGADATLPEGYVAVDDAEAKTVFGRHCRHGTDDEDCNRDNGCGGGGGWAGRDSGEMSNGSSLAMASYSLFLFNPGLSVRDTPVAYKPPFGVPGVITLQFNERSPAWVIPDLPAYGNVGPRWTHNFMSRIVIKSDTVAQLVTGDGSYVNYYVNTGNQNYVTRYADRPGLRSITASEGGPGFILTAADGSQQWYTQPDSPTPSFYLLSRVTDSWGNTTWLFYDTALRLTSIMDAASQVTTIGYSPSPGDGASNASLIRSITDPYGRKARLLYNSSGQLWKIVDAIGMTSEFHYTASGDAIDQLITPYGVTKIDSHDLPGWAGEFDRPPGRIVEVTDPYGDKQRVEQNDNAGYPNGGVDPNPPPGNLQLVVNGNVVPFYPKVENLHWRNTYYWDKIAWSTGPGDYSKATIYNWLADSNSTIVSLPASIKRPLEGRVWFNYPGQTTTEAPVFVASDSVNATNVHISSSQPSKILRAVEQPAGTVWTVEQHFYTQLDANGELSHATPLQSVGNITGVIDPEGRSQRILYGPDGRDITNVQVKDGGIWKNLVSFGNYLHHRASQIITAGGLITDTTANFRGQLVTVASHKGANVESTRYTYDLNLDGAPDAAGYLIRLDRTSPTNASQFVTVRNFEYDSARRVSADSDETGYRRTFAYDSLDRLTTITHPDSTTEVVKFDKLDVSGKKDRGGLWTYFGYTALGQRAWAQDPQGRLTQYEWCRCGDLKKLIDPMQKATVWRHDIQGRVFEKVLPDGVAKTTFAFQPLSGRLASMTSPNDQGGESPTVTYTYAINGSLQKQKYVDASVPDLTYEYNDPLGRLSGKIETLGGATSTRRYYYAAFDGATNGAGLLWKVDGPIADDTLRYSYDWRDRLVLREILTEFGQVTRSELNQRDCLGRLTSVVNGLGAFNYVYNAGNFSSRVDAIAGPNGLESSFAYYANNAAGGQAQSLLHIGNTFGGQSLSSFDYGYNASGNITSWTRRFGADPATAYTFGYNRSSELAEATLTEVENGSVLDSESYRYDANGNRVTRASGSNLQRSQYDSMNSLTQVGGAGKMLVQGTVNKAAVVTSSGVTQAGVTINDERVPIKSIPGGELWQYEHQVSVSEGQNDVTITATDSGGHSSTNIYRFTVGPVESTITYDKNGNLLSDGRRTFTWDSKNRLRSATVDGDTWAWDYDSGNRRSSEAKNGVVQRQWIWDGNRVVQERNAAGGIVRNFYREGEEWPGLVGFPESKRYYTYDHLGSVRELVDSAGSVRTRYDYDPYGKVTRISGDLDAEFRYTGHQFHAASGLHFAEFRSYDAELGRWISRDPLEDAELLPEGSNLYRYVAGNTINRVDRDGRFANVLVGVGIGIIVIIAVVAMSGALSPEVQRANRQCFRDLGTNAQNAWDYLQDEMRLDEGAEEWARRHPEYGISPREARRRAHRIKGREKCEPGGKGNWEVNPDTGEVIDPNGEHRGDIQDNPAK